MKHHSSMVNINGPKLKEILDKKALAPGKLGMDLGFDRYYITNHLRTGHLPEAVCKDLEQYYDISLWWYKADKPIKVMPTNMDNNVKVDSEKFTSLLKNRGFSRKEISETLGISYKTLNTCIDRGYLPKRYSIVLADTYKIFVEDYEPDPPEAEYIKNDISAVQEACEQLEKEKPMFKTVYNNKEIPVEEIPVVEKKVEEPAVTKKVNPKIDISKIVEEAAYRGTMKALLECFGLEEES